MITITQLPLERIDEVYQLIEKVTLASFVEEGENLDDPKIKGELAEIFATQKARLEDYKKD